MQSSKPEIKLSILIATVGRRNEKFQALIDQLTPQVTHFNGQIETVAYWNNGELTIGEIRQALLQEAKGEYVCFIDDDDSVPDYYCVEIMDALGEDYIGFEVQLFNEGNLKPPVYHSIRYGVWHQDEKGYYRGVTHLNPIKRSIAVQGSFEAKNIGEDETWAHSVTPFVRTENYIGKVMYYYYHNMDDSHFGGIIKSNKEHIRPSIISPYFRYHPMSKTKGKTKWEK